MNLQEYLDAVKAADIAIYRRNTLAQELKSSLLNSGIWTEGEIYSSHPATNKKVFRSDGEFWEITWSPSPYGPEIGTLQKLSADNIPSLQ